MGSPSSDVLEEMSSVCFNARGVLTRNVRSREVGAKLNASMSHDVKGNQCGISDFHQACIVSNTFPSLRSSLTVSYTHLTLPTKFVV